MCDPLTVLSVGSSLLSGFAQGKAQEAAASKARGFINQEDTRQNKIRNQANKIFSNSLQQQGADQQQADLAKDQAKRGQQYLATQKQAQLPTMLPGASKGAPAAKMEVTRALAQEGAKAGAEATAKGKLDAFGDLTTNNQINLSNADRGLAKTSNFAQGSMRPLDLELNAAQYAGHNWSTLGSLFDTVGKVAAPLSSMGTQQGWWGGYDPRTDIYWNSGRSM